MPEITRLSGSSDWIELEFVERERTPEQIIEVGIQLHLAGLSLSNTKQYLEKLGVERSRTVIHNWVQKNNLQPSDDGTPNQIALDETVIRVNNKQYWLYAAFDPETNEFLHLRLFQTRTTQLTVLFLREPRDKQQVEHATFLVDGAHHLSAALEQLGLQFQTVCHGNRNAVEPVSRELKRRIASFSNTFSNVEPSTAKLWLQVFAVWWNQC